MKLYVVRHGETVENANNCLVGRINSCLTENGICQAREVSKYFENKNIDLIVSSPLDRCKITAEVISNGKTPIVYSDSLLGRDHGEFTGKPRNSINYEEYWNYHKDIQYEKAESVKTLYNRIVKVVEDLKKEYSDKEVIIITHSGVIRMLYYYFNGIPDNGLLGEVEIKNCQVFEYEI